MIRRQATMFKPSPSLDRKLPRAARWQAWGIASLALALVLAQCLAWIHASTHVPSGGGELVAAQAKAAVDAAGRLTWGHAAESAECQLLDHLLMGTPRVEVAAAAAWPQPGSESLPVAPSTCLLCEPARLPPARAPPLA